MSLSTAAGAVEQASVPAGVTRNDRAASGSALRILRTLALSVSRLLPALALVAVAAHRWLQMGSSPPGIDQGHWLAFGRTYWGAGNSSLGDLFPVSIMPPLVPALMAAGSAFLGPEVASRLLAAGSLLAVMAATFVVVRCLAHPWLAAVVVVVAGSSATVVEPAAWGGYPQNCALAAMLLGVYFASSFLQAPRRRALAGCAAAMFAVSVSHHAYFAIAMATLAAAFLVWVASGPGWSAAIRRGGALALATAPGVAVFGVVALSLNAANYDPPIDASGSSFRDSLAYAFPTVPWLWALLGLASVAGIASRAFVRGAPAEWRCAVALGATAVAGFVATGEPRLLPPLVLAGAIGTAWTFQDLANRIGRPGGRSVALAAVLVVLALSWPSTDRKAQVAFDYYRVLDPSLVRAARFLDASPTQGHAAIRTDARGWPTGWWFRGLAARPLLVGSDAKWLAFPVERTQATLVSQLFAITSSPEEVRSLAIEHNVGLLVFRPADWAGWNGWSFNDGDPLVKVYDDGEYLVLEVRRAP